MNKRIWLSLGALVVVVCIIVSVFCVIGAGLLVFRTDQFKVITQPGATATSTIEATLAPQEIGTPEPTLPGGLTKSITDQMDMIQNQVIMLRGLQPNKTLDRALLTTDQLRTKVENDFFKDYSQDDAKKDGAIYSSFGLLPANFDLIKMYKDLYAEQIAGYYDAETKQMYVVQGAGFNGTERMTYAHEYTHALQDQNYDLRGKMNYNNDYCKTHSEYCAGVQSLIEGDATLVEQGWLARYATDQDKQQIQDFYKNYQSPVFDAAPAFMQADFLFPYRQGLDFVSYLYDKGGWQAVDNAFLNPPASSAQILHPDKYPAQTPVEVSLPDLSKALGSGWVQLDQNTLGEWYTYLLLGQGYDQKIRIQDAMARNAASGWSGDRYAVLQNAETAGKVLVLRSVWDSQTDTNEFVAAITQYGQLRWGDPSQKENNRVIWANGAEGYAAVLVNGHETLLVTCPDPTAADTIQKLFPDFPGK